MAPSCGKPLNAPQATGLHDDDFGRRFRVAGKRTNRMRTEAGETMRASTVTADRCTRNSVAEFVLRADQAKLGCANCAESNMPPGPRVPNSFSVRKTHTAVYKCMGAAFTVRKRFVRGQEVKLLGKTRRRRGPRIGRVDRPRDVISKFPAAQRHDVVCVDFNVDAVAAVRRTELVGHGRSRFRAAGEGDFLQFACLTGSNAGPQVSKVRNGGVPLFSLSGPYNC